MNRKTLFKVGCGGVVVAGVAAVVLFDVIKEKNLSQFSGDNLTPQDYEFMSYISTYGKSYETKEEYKMRAAQWAKTDAAIKEHNAGGAGGRHRHSWMKHNKYSAYTRAEWKKLRGYNHAMKASTTLNL